MNTKPVAWIQKNDDGRLIVITQDDLDNLAPEWQYIISLWKDAEPLYKHPVLTDDERIELENLRLFRDEFMEAALRAVQGLKD